MTARASVRLRHPPRRRDGLGPVANGVVVALEPLLAPPPSSTTTCLSVCLPACLSVCLPVCLSVCLPACLPVRYELPLRSAPLRPRSQQSHHSLCRMYFTNVTRGLDSAYLQGSEAQLVAVRTHFSELGEGTHSFAHFVAYEALQDAGCGEGNLVIANLGCGFESARRENQIAAWGALGRVNCTFPARFAEPAYSPRRILPCVLPRVRAPCACSCACSCACVFLCVRVSVRASVHACFCACFGACVFLCVLPSRHVLLCVRASVGFSARC